jgi:hypothetical protein
MKADVVLSTQPLAMEYLLQLESLTAELEAGMDAFGDDNVSGFKESIARQQQICASLVSLTRQIAVGNQVAGNPGGERRPESGVDRDLTRRIRRAAESLQACQRTYSALLKHASDSSRMFDGLCRSYTGLTDQSTGMCLRRSSWSC